MDKPIPISVPNRGGPHSASRKDHPRPMKRWKVPIVAFAILASLIAWRLQTKRADAAAQVQQRQARTKAPVAVRSAAVERRDIVETFESVGSVESPFNVRVATKTAGRIEAITVREGDRVSAGQVLVRIDRAEVEANLRQAQSNLAASRYRLAQAKLNLDPNDVGVNAQLRTQRAARESAQADLRQARANAKSSVASAESAITDAGGRVDSAAAAVASAEASVSNAQAGLDNARAKLARTQELYRQRYIAAQDLDDAKTAVSVAEGGFKVARSQYTAAQAQLSSAKAQKAVAQHNLDIAREKATADIEASQARATQAEAGLSVAQANRAQRPAFRESLSALAAEVGAAEGAARAAQARVADCTLTSPINGFVTERNMDPGATPTAGQVILAVQSLRELWVTVPVPEEVVRKMRFGMPASVSFDALPGRRFGAKVSQINPAADSLSRQFAVRVTLENVRSELKPGMFARVLFETERIRGAIVVPREAVQRGKSGVYVNVVGERGQTERRRVVTGTSDSEGIAIDSGLQPGEKVVVLSAATLKEGATVRTGGAPARGRGGRSSEGGSR